MRSPWGRERSQYLESLPGYHVPKGAYLDAQRHQAQGGSAGPAEVTQLENGGVGSQTQAAWPSEQKSKQCPQYVALGLDKVLPLWAAYMHPPLSSKLSLSADFQSYGSLVANNTSPNQALPISSCVALGNLLCLSEPWFPHL